MSGSPRSCRSSVMNLPVDSRPNRSRRLAGWQYLGSRHSSANLLSLECRMLQKFCASAMLVVALVATPAFAFSSGCRGATRQVAGMKLAHGMDGGIDIYRGNDFRWHQGLPPKGMVRGAQLYDPISISAGEKRLKAFADSIVWTQIDLDGDGRQELVVVSNLLQGHAPGYYNLTSLYVFCPFKDDIRLCGEAGFSNPPFFNSVLPSGARVPVSGISVSDYKVGPSVRLAMLPGPRRAHTIAVMPDEQARSDRFAIADIYRWSGPSASFTLLCRAR